MMEELLRSKFLGALVGTGVGDALGAGFEGWGRVAPEEIEQAAEMRKTLTYTDDTHMMIGIAESLIKSKGFKGEEMAQTFARNYELEPWRGYGPAPPYIFRLIRNGVDWGHVAQRFYDGGSYGNGSAMRIAPIGVFYHDNLSLLRDVACESSSITHAHTLGKEGAALQACAIALAANLESLSALDRGNFLAELTDFTPDDVYRQKLATTKEILDNPDESRVVIELGHGIEAFNSVPTAIFCFLSEPDSFAHAVLLAISLGGDTDTIAAMTGAISGACLGIESIPEKWRSKLENRLYIEELADKLYNLYLDINQPNEK
jgi:poly(ADP-ribose) glycohydrolase ARH3